MWQTLIDCLESDSNIKTKLSYLNSVINVHAFNLEEQDEINFVKSKVKEFCANATKRTEGLLLLYALVHSNSTVYVDNWSQIVLASLKCPECMIPKAIPLQIFNQMVINFGSKPEYLDIFSKVLNDLFPTIFETENDKIYKFSVKTLAVCMKHVPKAAGASTRMADIEKLLLKELDNPYGEIAEAIGECFAALPKCILHVPNSGPLEYKKIWCNVFMKIMNTMHSLLNNLMKLSEDQKGHVDVSGLAVLDIPSSESDNPIVQINIFKSLCQCMAKMMSSEEVIVLLPITELFKTLFRVFDIEETVKGENQVAIFGSLKLCFFQMLNGVYIVLEALILNFPIIEQIQNFVVLVNKSLEAMGGTFSLSSSVSQVRGSTWKLINVWLEKFGQKGSVYLCRNENIVDEILKDIYIQENVQSKQLTTCNVKEENQKANKVFACTHALKVLKNLVEVGVSLMKKSLLDKICSALLRMAKIVLCHMLQKKRIPLPYSDEKCKKMLFKCVCISVIYSDPFHSKWFMEAQIIFNAASRNSRDAKVGRLCHKFRKLSRYYLNPRKPPPDAVQYSHPNMLNTVPQPVIENVRSEWGNGIEWNSTNGPSSDDLMDDSEIAEVQEENLYSDKIEREDDLVPLEQTFESESHVNHEYKRNAKNSSHSMFEEVSNDSDLEPTFVSTDSKHHKISLNDSSHVNSFGVKTSDVNETRTEKHVSEVPNLTNNVENKVEKHVSFNEVKSAAPKPLQLHIENGNWKKKENSAESSDDSDMEEEGEEEANEENSDNLDDETSEGKCSPELDEERPSKRRKCSEEEGDDNMDEDIDDEESPVNNPSSEEEEINDVPLLEQNTGKSEDVIDDKIPDIKKSECKSPTIREMCADFVLAEPSAPDIS